jgi:formate hydrogenlyase subunit 4
MSMAGLIGIGVLQALILLLVAPVFSGFSRVLRAKIQTRKGPPLMQNYRDIIKLMKRQEVVSEQAGWVFRVAPYASMAAMLLVALMVPMLAAVPPPSVVGDLILVVYLFAVPVLFPWQGSILEAPLRHRRSAKLLIAADRAGIGAGGFRPGIISRINQPGHDQQ